MVIRNDHRKRLISIDTNDDDKLSDAMKTEIANYSWVLKPYKPPLSKVAEMAPGEYKPKPSSFFEPAESVKISNKLGKDLKKFNDKKECLVFIGLGSYDFGHGEDSCYRQQFPLWIDTIHTRFKETHILLIDPSFRNDNYPQIFDYNNSFKLVEQGEYGYRKYFDTVKNIHLHIYPTVCTHAEYSGKDNTLAGQDLLSIGNSLVTNHGAIVTGNFYSEKNEPFICLGLEEIDLTPANKEIKPY